MEVAPRGNSPPALTLKQRLWHDLRERVELVAAFWIIFVTILWDCFLGTQFREEFRRSQTFGELVLERNQVLSATVTKQSEQVTAILASLNEATKQLEEMHAWMDQLNRVLPPTQQVDLELLHDVAELKKKVNRLSAR